jgi:hypothetical protein
MLLNEAEHILSTMKSSTYQHTTHVDEANGIYDFDCSGFVDYALQQTLPEALAAIRYLPNRLNRPRAQDYYYQFAKSELQDDRSVWHSIMRSADLLPGDLIAWLRLPNSDSDDTGHVMIVRSSPIVDSNRPNEILVAIIDSTRSPHALDSRVNGASGIGTGTIGIVMNTTGSAVGFRWRGGDSGVVEYTKIAFGQLGLSQAYTGDITAISAATRSSLSSTKTSGPPLDALLLSAAVVLILTGVVVGIIQMKKQRSAKHSSQ